MNIFIIQGILTITCILGWIIGYIAGRNEPRGEVMKEVWLGIKDYIKDCWHDFWYWFWDALWTWTNKRCVKCYVWDKNEGRYTKEGSVWHYIQQRKIAKQMRKR